MNDQPAFFCRTKITDKGQIYIDGKPGLTKREYIATACLQGLLAKEGEDRYGEIKERFVKQSINYADELLKQLEAK